MLSYTNYRYLILELQNPYSTRCIHLKYSGTVNRMVNFMVLMVEVFPLEQAAAAFERMMTAKVHFRAVLKIGDESK
jgi:D-arabinose 1-dehydrogenase-like Zn-dependent alcohol dehydrogenase